MPTATDRVTVVSRVDSVAHAIRTIILTGDLAPGTKLPERDLISRYQIARPTARAVITALVQDRLLVRSSHAVARVRQLTEPDVQDIYRTRIIVETAAVRQLATHQQLPQRAVQAHHALTAADPHDTLAVITPDLAFHTALVEALNSPRLSAMYYALRTEVTLCMAHVQGQLDVTRIIADHNHVMECLRTGDPDAAAQAIDQHLSNASNRLCALLSSTPEPVPTRSGSSVE